MSKADAAERAVLELRTQTNSMERQYGKVSNRSQRGLGIGCIRMRKVAGVLY
jgi:hypothetical protein